MKISHASHSKRKSESSETRKISEINVMNIPLAWKHYKDGLQILNVPRKHGANFFRFIFLFISTFYSSSIVTATSANNCKRFDVTAFSIYLFFSFPCSNIGTHFKTSGFIAFSCVSHFTQFPLIFFPLPSLSCFFAFTSILIANV